MKRLCTICARGGSKGVLNKNIRELLGKSLIGYSIETALEAKIFDHIVVSTDSDKIAETSVNFGAEVFFQRPPEIATDTAAKIPVIRHALVESEKHYGVAFDIITDMDATSPLRNAEDVVNCVRLLEDKKYGNVITAMPARRSPYFNLVELDSEGRVSLSKKPDKPIVRRQDAPACFDMNASIYVWKRAALLEREGLFHPDTGLYVMPEERSIDIDSELDFEFVEFIMRMRLDAQR